LTLIFSVNAQIETPQPSPFSKVEQKVGLTDVTLEYSRPSMKGRTIFGDLVPYGKLWRLGANKNTMISFSDDVTIDGQTLKAGSYAIFATPNENSWDVVFYSDTNNWGAPAKWDDAKVAAKTTVETAEMPMNVETFTIMFGNLTSNSADLGFIWENTYAAVNLEVPTDDIVSASIEKTMAGPAAADYYNAAVYYSTEGKDLKKAEEWMNKAMSMIEKPGFWQLRQQSLIYAKMGDKKKAIEIAKQSLKGAKAAGNADYIKMNTESLKEWGAM
jgi:tetratricopeptide (TPR) repeat protein